MLLINSNTTIQNQRKLSLATKGVIIVLHALIGWLFCGALIGVGSQFMSLQATLIVHAIGAPLGFALISWFYFKNFFFTSPLLTAFLFLGSVVTLDVFVVALLIEKSFSMFTSPLGTWLPFSLIFCATYLSGELCTCARRPSS
jgi:hypothetical protein